MNQVHDVIDIAIGAAERGALDALRVLLHPVGQRCHVSREGRRDQMRAMPWRSLVEDRFELIAKAQVEHAIGFVEHHGGHVARLDATAIQMIEQAPGRPDHDGRPRRERAVFVAVRAAADHRRDAQLLRGVQPGKLVVDLLGELARGADDDGLRPCHGRALDLVSGQRVAEREADGQRLAGTGLRADAQVASVELGVEHRTLNRRQRRVAFLGQRGRQLGAK
jgi:hypothetical protein